MALDSYFMAIRLCIVSLSFLCVPFFYLSLHQSLSVEFFLVSLHGIDIEKFRHLSFASGQDTIFTKQWMQWQPKQKKKWKRAGQKMMMIKMEWNGKKKELNVRILRMNRRRRKTARLRKRERRKHTGCEAKKAASQINSHSFIIFAHMSKHKRERAHS